MTPPSPCAVSLSLLNASSLSSPYSTSDGDDVRMRYNFRSRREIFNYTLSIPTTINEESSRFSRTPSPHAERFTFRSLSEEFELPIPERSPLIAQSASCECPLTHDEDLMADTDVRGRHNSEDSGHVTMTEESAVAARADHWSSDTDVNDCPAETDKLLSCVSLTADMQAQPCKLPQEIQMHDLDFMKQVDTVDSDTDDLSESASCNQMVNNLNSLGIAEASA